MALLKLGSMASFKGASFTTTQWPVGQLGIPIPEWLARCRTLKLLHMLDIQTSQPSMLMVLGRGFHTHMLPGAWRGLHKPCSRLKCAPV
jgi:hypothetical protein